ncbi:hypothetical protein BJF93_06225 [Xaviernesmea oryzae]|uniref:DUF2076 domain-containing protein n=1 Tax=Xaviernesmea oryzae TaxID=464029 RepID=A0A1Q9AS17_9HYPH|nr:DUF2076 domain-containing protein [Xaviernesmea oryzae]OLP58217.1 hypothetical protein BJF93_06225 [Xaviernesmea oryzae]SEL46234.1 hypothetical protein SAMN04487976_108166 [Xaviernesmea oryzae]
MDHNDRQTIDGLFNRLAEAERQAGPMDKEADGFIHEKIARQPAAPYLMAQTIVVQEQALAMAEQRIAELEHRAQQAPAGGGGFFSSLFGGAGASRTAPPRNPAPGAANPWAGQPGRQTGYGQPQAYGQGGYGQGQPQGAWGQAQPAQRAGGGFMAGAAQTAMGVAGGMLLGSAISSMFSDPAQAAETAAGDALQEAGLQDAGFEDMGGFGGDEEV